MVIRVVLDALIISAHFVHDRFCSETICKADPDDDKYIFAAIESGAKYLISGDKHLLQLEKVERVEILTVHAFISKKHSCV